MQKQIKKIRARSIHAGMRYIDFRGSRGYLINEVRVSKDDVQIVFKGADGRFEQEHFGPMHRVTVKV